MSLERILILSVSPPSLSLSLHPSILDFGLQLSEWWENKFLLFNSLTLQNFIIEACYDFTLSPKTLYAENLIANKTD